MSAGYSVGDRVHVPGKGMGFVSYVFLGDPQIVSVHLDKTIRWRNNWHTILALRTEEVLPWECGIHEDCVQHPDLGRECILARVAKQPNHIGTRRKRTT